VVSSGLHFGGDGFDTVCQLEQVCLAAKLSLLSGENRWITPSAAREKTLQVLGFPWMRL
jgi:hypothetical protein